MITFPEFLESLRVVYKKNKSSISNYAIGLTGVAVGLYTYLNPYHNFDLYKILSIILFLILIFALFFILLFLIHLLKYLYEYIPYEIIDKTYWMKIIDNETPMETETLLIKTPKIILSRDFQCLMEFKIKLHPSGKKKLKRSRYSLIAYKPVTINLTLSSQIVSKSLQPKYFPWDDIFILNQLYEGNNDTLSFRMVVDPAEIDEGYICLYLIDNLDINIIEKDFEPNAKFLISKEKIFPSKLTDEKIGF